MPYILAVAIVHPGAGGEQAISLPLLCTCGASHSFDSGIVLVDALGIDEHNT